MKIAFGLKITAFEDRAEPLRIAFGLKIGARRLEELRVSVTNDLQRVSRAIYSAAIYIRSLKPERMVSGLRLQTLAISPAMQKPQTRHCSVP